MRRIKLLWLACLATIIALSACSSGKSAFEHGNYYEAVITSVNRLRKNDDHKKSVETLKQAYPMAVTFYEDRAKASMSSNAEFKWSAVVESYATINVMYEEIRRSPGALKVIPNPINYYAKLDEAKKNAAEENYVAGIKAMTVGTRDKAKVAYGLFKKTNEYVPGYKDVVKMTETALWNATVKVVMEPIPVQAKNISVSADFFNDKVSEYLHTGSLNQFVKFYTRKEAQTLKLNPDHVIKIEFDEFVVGQVYMNEKETKLEKDSVVIGTYVSPQTATSGNKTSSGTTGNTGTAGLTGGTVVGGAVVGGNTNTGNTNTGNTNTGNTNTGNTNTGNTNTGNTNTGNTNTGDTGNTNTGNSAGNNNQGGNNSGNANTGNSGGNNNNQGGANSGNAGGNNNNQGGNNSGNSNSGNSGGNNNQGGINTQEDTVKVTVCHIPPGNEANRHSLVISRSALKAHLAHGDKEGPCEEAKPKPKENNNSKKPAGHTDAGNNNKKPNFFASTSSDLNWLAYAENQSELDTTKIYTTVKATLYYYKKTTTSKGVISFRIIDAKTNALLSVEKMPGEFVWVSEWATFNGDERALTAQQLQLTKQKEKVPPPAQDLFIEFTRPIYDQVITKIKNFYSGY